MIVLGMKTLEKEQVASIIEEIVECCLKWFGHV